MHSLVLKIEITGHVKAIARIVVTGTKVSWRRRASDELVLIADQRDCVVHSYLWLSRVA